MLIFDDSDLPFVAATPHLAGMVAFDGKGNAIVPANGFCFGRMFPDLKDTTKDEHLGLKLAGLIELGAGMDKNAATGQVPDNPANNSTIPSGYTYLGQFIAHEFSFDGRSDEVLTEEVNPDTLKQLRSPTIDLDSLYGRYPDIEKDRLYEADNVRMKIGRTTLSNWYKDPPFDLPRVGEGAKPLFASIGDIRNDENLPTAQTHVAFLKFHNKVADWIDERNAKENKGPATFEEVSEVVIRHFQWIVLHDYLARVIDQEVLNLTLHRMRSNGGRLDFFNPREQIGLFMPVECSAAAFRFGHSMVRDSYEWNFFHNSSIKHQGRAALVDLFSLTGLSGDLLGNKTLPSEWIIDWTRFYEFSESNPQLNRARKLDINFHFRLADMKGFSQPPNAPIKFRPLPVRNLLRGFALRLPSGQDIARKLMLSEEDRLTTAEITEGPHEAILKTHHFDEDTPLWYYVLKEAEIKGRGNRLGPLGSRLVAETLVGLIRYSKYSILHPEDPKKDWRPFLTKGKFDMPAMLGFADVVNPIGTS